MPLPGASRDYFLMKFAMLKHHRRRMKTLN